MENRIKEQQLGRRCQVNGTEAASLHKAACGFPFSAPTRRRLPGSESSLPEESMVNRFEMMTPHSEQVVNRPVDREKSLHVCR